MTAKADSATLENGSISFGYSLNSAAKNVTLTVSDSSGNTVWTGSGTTTSGSNSFTWDGTTTNGTQLSDGGSYSLSVTATDSSGSSVYGYTTVSGNVTGGRQLERHHDAQDRQHVARSLQRRRRHVLIKYGVIT